MKHITLPFALLFTLAASAQQAVYHTGIQQTNVNLEGAPVVLGQLTLNAPANGIVLVQFDGFCVSDVGDRIILAASDDMDWDVNDGNVAVEATDADVNSKPFCHTRSYPVTPGSHTFYAVGENFVETAGSGMASVYGSLTVKYYPDGGLVLAQHTGIGVSSQNFRGAPVTLGQLTINAPSNGTAYVHFAGICYADVGDRIVLAASDIQDWGVNDGNVAIETVDSDINYAGFSHTRAYDISSGSHTFYAVGENFVETAGSGIGSVYGSLSVEFFPDLPFGPTGAFTGIQKGNEQLDAGPVNLAQLSISPGGDGTAWVHFDGGCYSSVGDRILLAANDVVDWGVNDGHCSLEAFSSDVNGNSFSHCRAFTIAAGSHTFYAAGERSVLEADGDGLASVYGSLTVQFYPSSSSGVEAHPAVFMEMSPNPTRDVLQVAFSQDPGADSYIEVFDNAGNRVARADGAITSHIDMSPLPAGVYMIRLSATDFAFSRPVVKL
jgi:hypothetical protein